MLFRLLLLNDANAHWMRMRACAAQAANVKDAKRRKARRDDRERRESGRARRS